MPDNPVLELMEAGAFIMLAFAAVLMLVAIRKLERSTSEHRGPIVSGIALILFAIPIYTDVLGYESWQRYGPYLRSAAALLLPFGLYLLKPLNPEHRAEADERREAP